MKLTDQQRAELRALDDAAAPGAASIEFDNWYDSKFKPAMERGKFDKYVARQAWFAAREATPAPLADLEEVEALNAAGDSLNAKLADACIEKDAELAAARQQLAEAQAILARAYAFSRNLYSDNAVMKHMHEMLKASLTVDQRRAGIEAIKREMPAIFVSVFADAQANAILGIEDPDKYRKPGTSIQGAAYPFEHSPAALQSAIAEAVEPYQWKPMETAPFGINLLVLHESGRVTTDYRSMKYKNYWTHWMQIPPAPGVDAALSAKEKSND